jgi:DNA-directed RNA polymerase subunit beta'
MGIVTYHSPVKFQHNGGVIETTVGRVLFNATLPEELRFINMVLDRGKIREIVTEVFDRFGGDVTADVVDKIKTIGFAAATVAGVSISINDVAVPPEKATMIAAAEKKVAEIDRQFQRGLITEQERYEATVKIWTDSTRDVIEAMMRTLDRRGSVYMMATSGARGNTQQMGQIGGMRGLIADPQGRIIDLPIRSNFREGLSVLEYFISTHGGRKGLADTAIRTADSGYLTRRLVDVAQDVIVRLEDCGDEDGIFINADEAGAVEPFADRLFGRLVAQDIKDKKDNFIAKRGEAIDLVLANTIADSGVRRVRVRSPLGCHAKHGICRACYGRSLASGKLVEVGEAVGIIAAQSIGEPGTSSRCVRSTPVVSPARTSPWAFRV